MKAFELEGEGRGIVAHPADQKGVLKVMCKNSEIPTVLYSGERVTRFTATKGAARELVYIPEIFVIELSVNDNKAMAIIKDMQFRPIADEILHMDFLEVSEDKAVVMEVLVTLEDHAEGVKAGGELSLQMRKLRVKAVYDQIPEKLTTNAGHLDLGRTMWVGVLHFEGLELISAKNVAIYAVQPTRAVCGAQAKG